MQRVVVAWAARECILFVVIVVCKTVFKSCEFKKKEAYRDKKKGRQDRDRINEAWLISTLEEGALERTEHYI